MVNILKVTVKSNMRGLIYIIMDTENSVHTISNLTIKYAGNAV